MDARTRLCAVALAAVLSLGARHQTPNFVVTAQSSQLAEQVGRAAEKFRSEIAQDWLGYEMPQWTRPCPITVHVRRGSGGVTTFQFHRGEVFDWHMTVQGTPQRILDSVLPHEVTHTIFASHFRCPLPRWADEGACTTVEHPDERAKQKRMLISFLRTGRGIAFSHMFRMKEYPRDVMPLYAQGHSLATFLLGHGGKRKFVTFVGEGLKNENWVAAIRTHYGYSNLGALQNTWLDWVRKGSPSLENGTAGGPLVASREGSKPKVVIRGQSPSDRHEPTTGKLAPIHPVSSSEADQVAANEPEEPDTNDMEPESNERRLPASGWHSPRRLAATSGAGDAATGKSRYDRKGTSQDVASHSSDAPQRSQLTRPQGVEQSRQIVLEWNKLPQSPQPARRAAPLRPARPVARPSMRTPFSAPRMPGPRICLPGGM